MSVHSDHPTIPRPALWAVFGLMALSLVAAAAGRYAEIGTVRSAAPGPAGAAGEAPGARPDRVRTLAFDVRPGVALAVFEAGDGARRPLGVIRDADAAFLSHVIKGLAHERKVRGAALDAPYQVMAWRTGRLAILDPATGRRIELNGFGATNTAAIAKLFALGSRQP